MGPRAEPGPLEAAMAIASERTPLLLPLPVTAEVKDAIEPVTALTLKELDPFARHPFWVWLRIALVITYWLLFVVLLSVAVGLMSRCRPVLARASAASLAVTTEFAVTTDDATTSESSIIAALANAAAAAAAAVSAVAEPA